MGPRFLEIELTGRCQLKCRHCYRDSPSPGDLPKETVLRIINQARDSFDCLIFSGGEPFLHPNILELVDHADKQRFSVHITTSGYRLPKKILDALPDNSVLVFGLDGIGPVHDTYRGKAGAWEELLKALYLWQKRPQEIITTLWKGVVSQIDEIAELAIERRAGLHFNALIPVGRARNNPEILLSRKENERVHQVIHKLQQKYRLIMTDHYKVTEQDLQHGIDLFCKGRFSIDPQGYVHPCEFLRPIAFGNVFEDDLPDIIQRAVTSPLIRARETGFKGHVHLDLPDPFDYHTGICHALAKKSVRFVPSLTSSPTQTRR